MEIFKPASEDHVELAHPVAPEDFETLNVRINGTAQSATWSPVPMKIIRVDEGRHLRETDAPWLGSHALVLRRNAVDALSGILSKNGEILPLACATDELYVFNPINLVDCLDEQASDVVRFSTGGIMQIKRHIFRTELLLGIDSFKIPNLRVSPLYVTSSFVARWTEAELTGLEWERVA
jgi:hypothetical protein